MKKIFVLLFIIVILGLSGCSNKALCPEWAATEVGQYCQTASLSITPPEPVALVSWEVAQIQLQNAVIVRSQGVEFYTQDGIKVEPNELQEGVFYTIKKTESTGAFWLSILDPKKISPNTHLLVAKP